MGKKPKPNPKPKRQCAFQANDLDAPNHDGLTKQHLFGNWLNGIFGRHERNRFLTSNYRQDANPIKVGGQTKRSVEHGSIFTKQLRVVCGNCNKGWMKRLEERASPTVRKLVLGEAITMDAQAQVAVAAWATQVAIIGQYASEDDLIISQEKRAQFRGTELPSGEWTVWIGGFAGAKHAFSVNQVGSWDLKVRIGDGPEVDTGDVVITIFAIGRLFCHVYYRTHQNSLRDPPTLPGTIRIWPLANPMVAWPAFPLVRDAELNGLAHSVRQFTSSGFYPESE